MDTTRFQDVLARSSSVLVVLPQNPDLDTVAAGLSLYLALTNYGKSTSVFCPSDMLVEFNRLVGVDRVSRELGEKNLTITLREYPADNIDRVSYNIEKGQMELTIIPKNQVNAPTPEQVVGKLGGMSADTAILIGNVTRESLGDGAYQELEKVPQKVQIAQRMSAPAPRPLGQAGGRPVEIIDPAASSISELVGNLLFDINLPVSGDAANNILMGVTTATNNFTSGNVRPETFELAAKVARIRNGLSAQGTPQGVESAGQAVASEAAPQEQTPADWTQAPKVYKSNLEG